MYLLAIPVEGKRVTLVDCVKSDGHGSCKLCTQVIGHVLASLPVAPRVSADDTKGVWSIGHRPSIHLKLDGVPVTVGVTSVRHQRQKRQVVPITVAQVGRVGKAAAGPLAFREAAVSVQPHMNYSIQCRVQFMLGVPEDMAVLFSMSPFADVRIE